VSAGVCGGESLMYEIDQMSWFLKVDLPRSAQAAVLSVKK
jgi:hypothetical protein